MNLKNKACFLDRDGVLIDEVNYLASPDKVSIIPHALKALSILKEYNYKIIVITNQSGVAKGYFTEKEITEIHAEIDRLLAQNNLSIDKYYYCPHHPEGKVEGYNINCDCRKPKPKLILQASDEFNINLKQSFLIGDKVSDLSAADKAGCQAVLVKTGHGMEHIEQARQLGFKVADNIEEAVIFYLQSKHLFVKKEAGR
ncbi:MAG: D-glycero-beta-D-manno-heptose 1,7-bisphosphate 7-phosphatase [Victivallales bacterium]|nr:D-glycero-beta-D-manno-heptose 1,7-bisphosphate 7-phosphatase [Victivallales bacterium]